MDTVCRYGGDEFVILLSEIELPVFFRTRMTTNNAVVTLEGAVIDSNAKDAAEQATRSVDGVRGVRNNLNTSEVMP